ncbi:MAG TPA: kynureninase [Nevskiaceae bacterium]|nr:kynureninase [Nevskiaceae bacterium]
MGLLSRKDCVALDQADPLRGLRERFVLPEGLIYLDGNSLGAMPCAVPARIAQLLEREWGEGLVRSWNTANWVDLPQRLGDKIGRIIGAQPGETLVADSTSVNLYKLLAMALSLRPQRRVILSERENFPTDLYIAQGLIESLGARHELRTVAPQQIESALDDSVAVLMLGHINYRSGAMHDLARLTGRAHAAGALVLWDLAHSAGAVPLRLAADGADFAVGCGYKFLNGGPGAPAFLYIAQRWHGEVRTPISGWFGHARPFEFLPGYEAAPGIARALAGTPPIISMAALEAGVELALEVSIEQLRAKSMRQVELLAALAAQELAEFGFTDITPREAQQRGSQLSLMHAQAWPITQALAARNVIGDFRTPDVLRLGVTPMYLGYAELWDAICALRQVMVAEEWRQPQHQQRTRVT